MAELHDLTALEQGRAVRSGEVSPVDLVDHYLDRVGRLSDSVGAFVTVTDELARKQALLAADGVGDTTSPLYGVPTAVKDLNTTAGVVTQFGSATMAGLRPDGVRRGGAPARTGRHDQPRQDQHPRVRVALLHRAGRRAAGPHPVGPRPDGRRLQRGSRGRRRRRARAGGAGADGGGSIRIPASCCGLFGLKPTRGRISGSPMYGDPVGLATAGAISRTVRDAAAMLDVLAGPAVGDPFWAPPPPRSFLASCDVEPGRLRIARFLDAGHRRRAVHPEVRRGLRGRDPAAGLARPRRRGDRRTGAAGGGTTFETCWAVLTALAAVPSGTEHLLRPLTPWLAERGRAVTGPEFGLAVGEARRIAARAMQRLAPYDAVLTPTLAAPPLPVGAIRDDDDPARDFENQKAFTPWTSAWNLTGMPAVSLPLHWTPDGLPVGVMLAGRPAEEHLLLSLSAQVEAAAPWLDRKPACW